MEIVKLATVLKNENIGGYRFMIVGFGEGLELFESYVESLNLSDRFIFTSYVPHEDVPKYISVMDIAVIPVGKKFTDTVRSSCKLKEVMAIGKAVVTVDFGSFRHETGYGKFAVLVRDNDNLTDAVVNLDRKTIRKLSMLSRKYVIKKFNFKQLSEKLEVALLKVALLNGGDGR